MFELSNSSKTNLSGLKTNVKLLICRAIAKSSFYFEIKAKEKFEPKQNTTREFEISSSGFKYAEIAEVFKQEFKQMQIEGHFCTCEVLVWGGDDKRDLQTHFKII